MTRSGSERHHEARGEVHHDESYFRAMYDAEDDPWGFDRRWYERRKYALTLAALPDRAYGTVFEPGCANGALTELLQRRCGRLVASELLPDVAERARRRLSTFEHVEVHVAAFPDWWPDEALDLVVLSEIGYYLHPLGRARAAAHLLDRLAPGGQVVAVHYTGPTDYPMRGSEVARWLDELRPLRRVTALHDDRFELGVWRRDR